MTSPSPDAEDLALLVEAAEAAGEALKARFGRRVETWSKGAAGPVTEADYAANAILAERLRGARPDYGWLSEETPDDRERLERARTFVVDPLDGTVAFLKGVPEFCVSVAIVENGRPVAGVVRNPMTEETFAARAGAGASRNGQPIAVSARTDLSGARMIGPKEFYADSRWPTPWPPLDVRRVRAIAYRLALVASGEADGLVTLGFKAEWDTAAGAALVAEAGGRISDPWGGALRYNQPDPRGPGAVAAGPLLHPLLVERTRVAPRPIA